MPIRAVFDVRRWVQDLEELRDFASLRPTATAPSRIAGGRSLNPARNLCRDRGHFSTLPTSPRLRTYQRWKDLPEALLDDELRPVMLHLEAGWRRILPGSCGRPTLERHEEYERLTDSGDGEAGLGFGRWPRSID